MKIIIVGKHASGKHEVLNLCEHNGVKVGREFCNIDQPNPKIYMDPKYTKYSNDDISNIFELKAYLSIGGIEESEIIDSYMYHRGISAYALDQADVLVMTLAQFDGINKQVLLGDKVIFVWLDNTQDNRIRRHAAEDRTYSFKEQEDIELSHGVDFVKNLYDFPGADVMYFTNEEPERVAAIITALVRYPDLAPLFIKHFN